MSLVKLFMKQKSISTEGMSLTLDQTDSSTGGDVSETTSATINTVEQSQRRQTPTTRSVNNDFAIKWLKPTTDYDCNDNHSSVLSVENKSSEKKKVKIVSASTNNAGIQVWFYHQERKRLYIRYRWLMLLLFRSRRKLKTVEYRRRSFLYLLITIKTKNNRFTLFILITLCRIFLSSKTIAPHHLAHQIKSKILLLITKKLL